MATTLTLFLTVAGCADCYPLWPLVLVGVTLLLLTLTSRDPDVHVPDRRLFVLRAGITALLFTLTWYPCASVKRQALHGFGERIGAMVGEDQLIAWASDVIAASPKEKVENASHAFLVRDQIPDFIHELMGGNPESTRVGVYRDGQNAYVTVSNSSQKAFQITVRPSRVAHEAGGFPPQWWVQESAGVEWRPGIYLDTLGNFR